MKKILSMALLVVALFIVGMQANVAEAAIQVVGVKNYLSIRERPNVNSRELARVPNGTVFYEIFDDQRAAAAGFFAIKYNGIYGYVSEKYVRYI